MKKFKLEITPKLMEYFITNKEKIRNGKIWRAVDEIGTYYCFKLKGKYYKVDVREFVNPKEVDELTIHEIYNAYGEPMIRKTQYLIDRVVYLESELAKLRGEKK